MTPEEILQLVENRNSQEKLAATGFQLVTTVFQLAEQKYFYLSGKNYVIRGKPGKPQGRGAHGEDQPGSDPGPV